VSIANDQLASMWAMRLNKSANTEPQLQKAASPHWVVIRSSSR
jgi:hypothetical protein